MQRRFTFCIQGDKERAQKMPTTPMCDRNTQERVALQKGFVDYVIGPYYKLVAAAYPSVAPVFDLIKHNREAWNRKSLCCVFLFVVGYRYVCVSPTPAKSCPFTCHAASFRSLRSALPLQLIARVRRILFLLHAAGTPLPTCVLRFCFCWNDRDPGVCSRVRVRRCVCVSVSVSVFVSGCLPACVRACAGSAWGSLAAFLAALYFRLLTRAVICIH